MNDTLKLICIILLLAVTALVTYNIPIPPPKKHDKKLPSHLHPRL